MLLDFAGASILGAQSRKYTHHMYMRARQWCVRAGSLYNACFERMQGQPGSSMTAAHMHLIREKGLTLEHFDMVVQHMGDALAELDGALHELADPSVSARSPCLLPITAAWSLCLLLYRFEKEN